MSVQQQTATVPVTGVNDARSDLSTATPSVPITVHPLVLLNITDDAARIQSNTAKGTKAKDGDGDPNLKEGCSRVPFGIVMGTSGHETSAHTCVDFVALRDDATGKFVHFDWNMARKRVNLCREVLQSYDVVGWYTTGTGLDAELVTTVHNAFLKEKPGLESSNMCPKPIVVVMNTAPAKGSRGVPVVVFESKAGAAGSSTNNAITANQDAAATSSSQSQPSSSSSSLSTTSMLTRVEFTFESEETERIGVQQAADTTGTGTGNWVGPAADRFSGAVNSLNRRIDVVILYLKAVKEGKIQNPDAEMLRRIKQCATKLPRPEDALELRGLLGEGVSDALTTTLVSLMTKGALGLNQLVEDMSTGNDAEANIMKH